MRSLALRRGMGDSAQCLLHAGAVTLSHVLGDTRHTYDMQTLPAWRQADITIIAGAGHKDTLDSH
jgi:hypothetical protein